MNNQVGIDAINRKNKPWRQCAHSANRRSHNNNRIFCARTISVRAVLAVFVSCYMYHGFISKVYLYTCQACTVYCCIYNAEIAKKTGENAKLTRGTVKYSRIYWHYLGKTIRIQYSFSLRINPYWTALELLLETIASHRRDD